MGKPKIMIVEDDKIISMEMKQRLTNMGYEVVAVVTSGADAIETATNKSPDLVLMDIKLEGYMDGIQAADKIHYLLDIPILYLTAYSDDLTYQRAKETDPSGFLAKPFDEKVLQAEIEYALENRNRIASNNP